MQIDIREADEVRKTLFYAGEKPPHMRWSILRKTHKIVQRICQTRRTHFHSDSMKIRMLVDKIKADFLTPTKARLEIELISVPTNITYEQALSLFRNMVNQKHPPQMGAVQNRTRRQINQATTGGRHSRGRGGLGRGGRGARGNRVGGRGNRTRTDSRMITLTDGSQIKYHASFTFPRHIYLKMKQEDRETLKRERAAYNQTRSGGGSGSRSTRSEIQELRSQIQELQNAGSASGTVASNTPLRTRCRSGPR
jgi:polyhydroxyalkanoate synthesis regulator phasin